MITRRSFLTGLTGIIAVAACPTILLPRDGRSIVPARPRILPGLHILPAVDYHLDQFWYTPKRHFNCEFDQAWLQRMAGKIINAAAPRLDMPFFGGIAPMDAAMGKVYYVDPVNKFKR